MAENSKILFVEDEINGLIPNIIMMFKEYLSTPEIEALNKLEDNINTGCVSCESVKELLKKNPILKYEYSFPEALKKITAAGNAEDYSLFIIDRNLSGKDICSLDTIQEVIPGYDNNTYERYCEREGDFLLLLLHLQGCQCVNKFYFYSAYPGEDIKSALFLQTMIGYETFSKHNFIDKADDKQKEKFIKNIINKPERAKIIAEFRDVFEAVRNSGLADCEDSLINILLYSGAKPQTHLGKFRNILEKVIYQLDYQGKYSLSSSIKDGQVKMRDAFKNLKERIPSYIYSLMDAIYTIESNYGSHSTDSAKDMGTPTQYTTKSLLYGMIEIIKWLDSETQSNNKTNMKFSN